MSKREAYTQGTPSWVDLMTPDPEGAKNFYGGLFGWRFEDVPMDTGGVYTMATIEGDQVAGLGGQNPEMAGSPAMWNVYLAVDDVDAAAAKVPEVGGKVEMPPTDVMDQGRMAIVTDPAGATVGMWQAGKQSGAQRHDEPGANAWNELVAPEYVKAVPFYEAVVGVDAQMLPMGDTEYAMFTVDGQRVAGAMPPPTPDTPPHWNVYFNVEDVDAACAKAEELGGRVVRPAFDIPGMARVAVLTDPQGAWFQLMKHLNT